MSGQPYHKSAPNFRSLPYSPDVAYRSDAPWANNPNFSLPAAVIKADKLAEEQCQNVCIPGDLCPDTNTPCPINNCCDSSE